MAGDQTGTVRQIMVLPQNIEASEPLEPSSDEMTHHAVQSDNRERYVVE